MGNQTWCRLLFLMLMFSTGMSVVRAQLDDTRFRQQVSLAYSPVKSLELTGMYRLDLIDNMGPFHRNNFEIGATYSVLKWLRIGSAYRFVTSYKKDVHRLELNLSMRKSTVNKKSQFTFKSSILFVSDYIDRDYFRYNDPTWIFRNKFRYRYSISKKVDVYAFTELFARHQESRTFFYRTRNGVGINYAPKKRHTIGFGYYYQYEFNRKNPEDTQTFEIEYQFEIRKKKKKSPAPQG